MVGVQRIGEVAEPANPRRATERGREVKTPIAAKDEVTLSPMAEQASAVAKILEKSEEQSQAQKARIEEIREALDKGTYQVQQVVLQVASRMTRYLSA